MFFLVNYHNSFRLWSPVACFGLIKIQISCLSFMVLFGFGSRAYFMALILGSGGKHFEMFKICYYRPLLYYFSCLFCFVLQLGKDLDWCKMASAWDNLTQDGCQQGCKGCKRKPWSVLVFHRRFQVVLVFHRFLWGPSVTPRRIASSNERDFWKTPCESVTGENF